MANAERGGFFEANKSEKALYGGLTIAVVGAFFAPSLILPGLLLAGGGEAARIYRDRKKE